MIGQKSYSVESAYVGRDKQPRCYVRVTSRDRISPGPYQTDDLLAEGQAVTVSGNRATRYFNTKDL